MKKGVRIMIAAERGQQHVAFLRRNLGNAISFLGSRCALRELSVAIVGDATMSKLHLQFMNEKGPTDVLTFPLDLDRRGRATAGEIVVDFAEARRRAGGEPLRNELLLYAIHGLLHLCGHDDRTARGFRQMHHLEDEILTALGIGPVFARPQAGGRS